MLILLLLALVSFSTLVYGKHQQQYTLRGLKGGKGGGGGGGSGRGSSSSYGSSRPYGNTSRSNNCRGEDCNNSSTGVIVGVVVLAVVTFLGLLCCYFIRNQQRLNEEAASPSKSSPSTSQSFDDLMATARSEQAASPSGFRSHDPKSGTYECKYKQNRKTKEGTVLLYFTEDNGGYELSGSTTDENGVTNIDEGFATYDGKAWWKESSITGESGLQVLNKGKFDFSTHSFEGEWWANTGISGKFVSFVLQHEEEDTKTFYAAPETAVGGSEVPFSLALAQ
jgi:hypothetical protein